jgi:hypothetical protein
MATMSKFTLRIASCGFALACLLFAASFHWGHTTDIARLETIFWPTRMLLSGRANAAGGLNAATLAAVGFSALMNGALYFGLGWIVWWALRLAGITKVAVGEKDRAVSLFLVLGLGFAALVALAEAAFRGLPKFTARGLADAWLISANLFALIVITCAAAGWAMWWLGRYFRGYSQERDRVSPGAARKS